MQSFFCPRSSTCADIVAAIAASAKASALVTAVVDGTDTEVAKAVAKAYLSGGVTVTPGNLVMKSDMSAIYVKTDAQTWGTYTGPAA